MSILMDTAENMKATIAAGQDEPKHYGSSEAKVAQYLVEAWNDDIYDQAREVALMPFAFVTDGYKWIITCFESTVMHSENIDRSGDEPTPIMIARNIEKALNAARDQLDVMLRQSKRNDLIAYLQAAAKPIRTRLCAELPPDTDRDHGNGCQGCGGLYADKDVMIVDGVGPVCRNCVFNTLQWGFEAK